ncbi:MAG: Ig-like domain-containing protein [Methanobacteriaceae archaeon]
MKVINPKLIILAIFFCLFLSLGIIAAQNIESTENSLNLTKIINSNNPESNLSAVTSADTGISMHSIQGRYGETIQLKATYKENENPIKGKRVEFYERHSFLPIDMIIKDAYTDENGIATINYTVEDVSNSYFNDMKIVAKCNNYESSTTPQFSLGIDPNILTVNNVNGKYGETIQLKATYKEHGKPIKGKRVEFYLKEDLSSYDSRIGTAYTDENGIATTNYTIDKITNRYSNSKIVAKSDKYEATASAVFNLAQGGDNLVVSSVNGKYGETVILKASVQENGVPLEGKRVEFYIREIWGFDDSIGTAYTDENGIATTNYTIDKITNTFFRTQIVAKNDKYESTANAQFDRAPGQEKLTINPISGKYGETIQLKATYKENGVPQAGQEVDFYIRDSINSRSESIGSVPTDQNGIATIDYKVSKISTENDNIVIVAQTDYYESMCKAKFKKGVGNENFILSSVKGKCGETIALNTLSKENGVPKAGEKVDFYKIKDDVKTYIGTGYTSQNGIATVSYKITEKTVNSSNIEILAQTAYYEDTVEAQFDYGETLLSLNSTKGVLGDNIKITAKLTTNSKAKEPIANKSLKFYIDGMCINETTNENGEATINYKLVKSELTKINCEFVGDDNYLKSSGTYNLTADKIKVLGYLYPVSCNYNITTPLKASLKDFKGKAIVNNTIKFYCNGKYIGSNKTNSQGIAIFNYKSKNTGKFQIKAISQDNPQYSSITVTNYLNVAKKNSKMILSNIKTKLNKKVTISTVLKDTNGKAIKGKIVKFYINSKLIGYGKTNSKGVAKITYTPKKSGNFKIKAMFNGDELYNKNQLIRILKVIK